MGLLVDGRWHDRWYDTVESGGRSARSNAQLHNWVTQDGSPGPSGEGGFSAERDRYHLYVSLACPWAHRTLIMRALKGLEALIPVSIVHWQMREHGWTFAKGPGVVPDPIHQARYLHQIYTAADPAYCGRVTVPILWDKQKHKIACNESSEIIRMLGSAFDAIGAREGDYFPTALRDDIEAVNACVYETLNNGVYRAGFASTQTAYEEAVFPLFETLDWLDARLAMQRYLVGDRLTEADVLLFTTLVRFDAVYHGHFKCNLKQIVNYPNLWAYARDLYQTPGFGSTTNFAHAKRHYYESHDTINPSAIVPAGPVTDWASPHGRRALGQDDHT